MYALCTHIYYIVKVETSELNLQCYLLAKRTYLLHKYIGTCLLIIFSVAFKFLVWCNDRSQIRTI